MPFIPLYTYSQRVLEKRKYLYKTLNLLYRSKPACQTQTFVSAIR